jgi:uncharacterized delta-60 repeat protein
MWFLSARRSKHLPIARSQPKSFRPRLEALEDRCLLSAGALDTTFGGSLVGSNSPDGTVLGQGANAVEATVVYPSTDAVNHDKIVVGGGVSVTTKQGTTSKFALQRYNPNGSLDASFGTQGTVLTAIGISASLQGLAVQSDGKIIAVGEASANSTANFVVVRYTTDGHLDSSFGTNGSGYVITQVLVPGASTSGINQSAQAVAIQGTGSSEKIYVGGWAGFSGNGHLRTMGSAFAVVRYTASGSPDTVFGNGGIAVGPNFANQSNAFGLAIQPDGKILLAGNSYPSAMAVVRFTTAGRLDSSANDPISPFGSNGSGFATLTPPNSGSSDYALANGILIQSGGAIVLSGYGYYPSAEKQVLALVSPSGTLDTTFGTSGFAVNPYILNGHNIVQAANGDLLTAGTVGSKTYDASDDFGVAAYLPNGTPDTTFGNSSTLGTNSVAITNGEDMGWALALQSDGKIVVGGFSYNATTSTYSAALARFLPSNTQVGFPTATPNPVSAGTNVTLTVSNISDNAYPVTTVTQVSFYQDTNGNGVLDIGDTLLGTGTLNTSTDVWSFTFSTTGLHGIYTLFAQATDGSVLYDPVSIQVTVN